MTTAVIYAAKSTTDEKGSLDSQTAACREHAERNGWEVAGEYRDEAASGYSGSRGTGLVGAKAHAAKLAEEGADAVLLAFATDRFARGDGSTKAAHLVEHVLDARKAGYRVESVSENIGGEMAVLLASLYGERANKDSEAKSAHIRRGLAEQRARGRYMGTRAPFGYRFEGQREERRIVPDPTTAPWYLKAVEWTEAGAGCREVALRLNERGVPSPTGKKWDRSQITSMLRSPIHKGEIVYRHDGEEEHLPGAHEPLIDQQRWEGLQRLRESRRARGRRPEGRHLLTAGILRCPRCTQKMRARTTPAGYEFYACSSGGRRANEKGTGPGCDQKNINARELDEQIIDHLLTVAFDPEEIAARVEAQVAELTDRAAEYHAEARRKVSDLDARIKRVKQEYLGVVSPEEWQQMMDDLAAQRGVAQAHADDMLDLAAEEERRAADLDAERTIIGELEQLRAALASREEGDVQRIRERIALTFGAIRLRPCEQLGRYVLHAASLTDAARERLAPADWQPIRYEVPEDLRPELVARANS